MDAPDIEETPEEAAAYKATKAAGCTCNPAIYDGTDGTVVEHSKPCELYWPDHRIQKFYDNAAQHGMSPGDYAVHLLGAAAIADLIEGARQGIDLDQLAEARMEATENARREADQW